MVRWVWGEGGGQSCLLDMVLCFHCFAKWCFEHSLKRLRIQKCYHLLSRLYQGGRTKVEDTHTVYSITNASARTPYKHASTTGLGAVLCYDIMKTNVR